MKTTAIALLAIMLVSCEKSVTPPDNGNTQNPKEENVQPKFTVVDTVIDGYDPFLDVIEVPVSSADIDYTITDNGKPFEQSPSCYIDITRAKKSHCIHLNGVGVNLSPRVMVIESNEYHITINQEVITSKQVAKYNPVILPLATIITFVDAGFYGAHGAETVLYKEFGSPVTNVIQDNGETTIQRGYFSSLTKCKKGASATEITLNIEANTTSKDRKIEIFNASSYNHYTTITQQGVK